MLCAFLTALFISHAPAYAQVQKLKLYYIHTGEKATITYKRNGRYIPAGLKKVNWHLRDWRRNEPTKMDPELLDLVWEAYRRSGSKGYITVISGYRSPASNSLLRKRGRGVAKNSQHTRGKALDFYLPDVKLSKLREIGLKLGVGGVGYYPKSGSPFVHFDTGNVRHWPRMTRKQLARVFPRGDTMHVPTDGKPLARYKQAVAAYKRKKATGTLVPKAGGGGTNLFARLTSRNNSDDEAEGNSSNAAPAPRRVTTKPAEEAATQHEFAALPNRVPVPILAPRGVIADEGTEIVIAAAEPVPAPQREELPTDATPLAREEDQPEGTTIADEALDPTLENAETAETALASVLIPVPVRRPEFEDATPVADSGNVLAMVDPNPPARVAETERGSSADILSASEIEDLRLQVRSTIGATNASPAPRPAVGIASAPATDASNDLIAKVEAVVTKPAEPAVVTTSTGGQSAILTAALSPIEIEPGLSKSGKLPLPSRNPAIDEDTAAAPIAPTESDVEIQEEAPREIVLASLPVPIANPLNDAAASAPVETKAAAKPKPAQPQAAETKLPSPELVKRTISLDRYSAPEENSSTIGQFALKATTTIRELADVRAPAYGRNVIREVPQVILVQGFNLQPFGPSKNSFSGKAVTKNFARQRIN